MLIVAHVPMLVLQALSYQVSKTIHPQFMDHKAVSFSGSCLFLCHAETADIRRKTFSVIGIRENANVMKEHEMAKKTPQLSPENANDGILNSSA